MLSQKYRFHGRKSLGFVFRSGITVRSSHFLLRIHQAPGRSLPRAAVVVSKKISKRAVVRNRIRRRVYEATRRNWRQQLHEPYDVAYTVLSSEAAAMPAAELEAEIAGLLRQARVAHARRTKAKQREPEP